VIARADEVALVRLVGTATYARGNDYARRGMVRTRVWSEGGTRAVGEVQGSDPIPYVTSLRLARSGSGALTSFSSSCTCPIGANCKHAVALLLSADPPASLARTQHLRLVDGSALPGRGRPGRAARTPARPRWESALAGLLDADEVDDEEPGLPEGATAPIGLQFDLVLGGAAGTHGTAARPPSIRIRPVVPGRNGAWVRTGISWSNVDYLSYGRRFGRRGDEQLDLVREVLALARLGNRRSRYSYADDVVTLEGITSRRVWDLFRQARDLHLPLVRTGRHPAPLTVHAEPAEPALEVVRTDTGLSLRPTVEAAGDPVPLDSSLLLGHPAHGIAWWDDAAGASSYLDVAPFADPVDDALAALLGTPSVEVPEADEDRFVRGVLPRLRRAVPVVSDDPEVDLPEELPVVLVLSARYGEGQRIELSWVRTTEGSSWREGLWQGRGGAHDTPAAGHLIEQIATLAVPVPALFEAGPYGRRLAAEAELEGMDAVHFVISLLPALRAMDGVRIEETGARPEYRESEEAPLVSLGGAPDGGEEKPTGKKDNDWFDLTVSVSVGGEGVPFAELFTALAAGKSHLILPSGTYFSLDRPELVELAQLIAEARAMLDSSGDELRLSRFQASMWEDLVRLGVVTAQAGAWEESVRSLSQASDSVEQPVPEGLLAELRPYQHQGFNWLASLYRHRLGGVLADDMGLGKTLEALALMLHTREQGLTDAPYLVVAPTSVVGNWAAECRRFTPDLTVATVTETTARRGQELADLAAGVDLVVTSYSLFRLEYDEYAAIGWAGMFLDEAQFAKNHRSQTYQRAKLLPVPFKVAMTGTPIENNLMELWSLLSITAPGLFPSPERFGEYYRLPIERNQNADRLEQLRRRIRPLMLRRTKEQVAGDLPDKQEQVLELELVPRHRRIYQTHLQRERQKVLGLLGDLRKNRFAIFTSLTLLRQAALDVSLIDAKYEGVPSTKLDALMEMVEDVVADGHKVLVFSQFTRFLGLARDRIEAAGIEHCYLDGRTRKREAVIDRFRSGGAPVFLISLKAGGFGLNLTEADYCILLDPWWNPATEAQAVDRVHRIGQTRKVMVYRLVAKDTLEEKVMALKAKKAALFADVMDAGGLESGALTAADIAGLLE
jgi:superfamily II DNA or RNA helicase